ncbi:hypothetical protein K350107B32_30460 [Agathobaculum butyriciproducens]
MRKGGERHAAVTRLSFPILQRSPVSGLRQTKKQKEVGVKRVETIGVYPLAPPRGAATFPPSAGGESQYWEQPSTLYNLNTACYTIK